MRVRPPGASPRADRSKTSRRSSDYRAQRFLGGGAAVGRWLETLMLEGVFQRLQDEHHILGGGAVAHQSDAEDLARQRSQTARDFDPAFLQQELAHFGVIHAVRYAWRIERP